MSVHRNHTDDLDMSFLTCLELCGEVIPTSQLEDFEADAAYTTTTTTKKRARDGAESVDQQPPLQRTRRDVTATTQRASVTRPRCTPAQVENARAKLGAKNGDAHDRVLEDIFREHQRFQRITTGQQPVGAEQKLDAFMVAAHQRKGDTGTSDIGGAHAVRSAVPLCQRSVFAIITHAQRSPKTGLRVKNSELDETDALKRAKRLYTEPGDPVDDVLSDLAETTSQCLGFPYRPFHDVVDALRDTASPRLLLQGYCPHCGATTLWRRNRCRAVCNQARAHMGHLLANQVHRAVLDIPGHDWCWQAKWLAASPSVALPSLPLRAQQRVLFDAVLDTNSSNFDALRTLVARGMCWCEACAASPPQRCSTLKDIKRQLACEKTPVAAIVLWLRGTVEFSITTRAGGTRRVSGATSAEDFYSQVAAACSVD